MNPIKKHRLALTFAWFWPVLMILILWLKMGDGSVLWLLRKSTWVLAIGVVESFVILLGPKEKITDELEPYITGLFILALVSVFLLPFGMNEDIVYGIGLCLSVAFHGAAFMVLGGVVYALSKDAGQHNVSTDYDLSDLENPADAHADCEAREAGAFLGGLVGGYFLVKHVGKNHQSYSEKWHDDIFWQEKYRRHDHYDDGDICDSNPML